jgi:RNA-binding protein Musashi
VSQETTENEFKDYFAQFGRVVDATLMMDKDTGRPRGFGFVTFENEVGVEACLNTHLEIHGKAIEVKKAQPRGNMREEEEASKRGRFKKAGMDDQNNGQNVMANQMNQGGMTPQVMAQYMQRMQQYMAMMQQQAAMNRGMGMNPAMMQMFQLQQMQQMQQQMAQAGGNNQNMAALNQAMMQQMQNQMMGNAGSGQSQSPGNDEQQGYNDYNQQQGFNQRGGGGRRGGRGGYNQGYNNNMGGGGGSANGDPTSWEGMYDDVPQPNYNHGGGRGGFHRNRAGFQQSPTPTDPSHAPPANAPTGPKNAGKPGANYRGGGRGGNRGYHPYGR